MIKRLHYFDMLKGIAIFMVVMGHVLTFCVRGIDRASLFKFIEQVHMPLFFFISGWLTYKVNEQGLLKTPNLVSRAKRLLVPMVIVSTLWIFYFPHSGLESPLNSTFVGLWSSTWKNGYWFTLVLFQIILIYCVFAPLFGKLRGALQWISAIAVIWVALVAAVINFPTDIIEYVSFDLTATFWPVFMSGLVAARYRETFGKITNNSYLVGGAIVVCGVLIYFLSWPWEFEFMDISLAVPMAVKAIFHVSLAIVAIAVVKPWSEKAFSDNASGFTNRIAKTWQYLGNKSLAIYLLHYFFLFPLGCCQGALDAMKVSFTPLVFFSAFVASGIIVVTLGADAIISRSAILSFLLTGSVTHNKQKTIKSVA